MPGWRWRTCCSRLSRSGCTHIRWAASMRQRYATYLEFRLMYASWRSSRLAVRGGWKTSTNERGNASCANEPASHARRSARTIRGTCPTPTPRKTRAAARLDNRTGLSMSQEASESFVDIAARAERPVRPDLASEPDPAPDLV